MGRQISDKVRVLQFGLPQFGLPKEVLELINEFVYMILARPIAMAHHVRRYNKAKLFSQASYDRGYSGRVIDRRYWESAVNFIPGWHDHLISKYGKPYYDIT